VVCVEFRVFECRRRLIFNRRYGTAFL
jgi:hypothetical protein